MLHNELMPIEWQPMPMVVDEESAKLAIKRIAVGEQLGMFIPAGSELALDMNEHASDQLYVPLIVEAAREAGLIAATKQFDFVPWNREKGEPGLGLHFDMKYKSALNLHLTLEGNLMGVFVQPTKATVTRKNNNWVELTNRERLSDLIMRGMLDLNALTPLVEVVFAGPGDRVAFIETPVAGATSAVPPGHMFHSLTRRSSGSRIYGLN